MLRTTSPAPSTKSQPFAAAPSRPVLQRKCACGTQSSGPACSECSKESLQRRPAGMRMDAGAGIAPPIVHDVLRSSGEPLDASARAFFEQRLGHDFSCIRVHHDDRSADSARAVDAFAYTVGPHIVFNAGQYSPETEPGRQLLAHELTHAVQQGGSPTDTHGPIAIDPSGAQEHEAQSAAIYALHGRPSAATAQPASLQRACLTGAACTGAGQGAQTTQTLAQPQNVANRERRKQLCNKKPPDPGCTSDGHAARAVETEKLLFDYDSERRTLIHGIFVDKDIPSDWRAYRKDCNAFTPPLDGDKNCIFVPDTLEKNACQFNNSKDPTIDTEPRDEWQRFTLRVLMHETGHARFKGLLPSTPGPTACKLDDINPELQEIAADLDEAAALDKMLQSSSLTSQACRAAFDKVLSERWAKRAKDNWTRIRCACECEDAASYVRRTVDTMSVDWDNELKVRYHEAIRFLDPTWPVEAKPFGLGDFPEPSSTTKSG
jgi:hypothetical protein